jgi:hypothetical protein
MNFPPGTAHAHKSELLLYCGEQAIDLVNRGIDVSPLARWPWTGIAWAELRKALLDS